MKEAEAAHQQFPAVARHRAPVRRCHDRDRQAGRGDRFLRDQVAAVPRGRRSCTICWPRPTRSRARWPCSTWRWPNRMCWRARTPAALDQLEHRAQGAGRLLLRPGRDRCARARTAGRSERRTRKRRTTDGPPGAKPAPAAKVGVRRLAARSRAGHHPLEPTLARGILLKPNRFAKSALASRSTVNSLALPRQRQRAGAAVQPRHQRVVRCAAPSSCSWRQHLRHVAVVDLRHDVAAAHDQLRRRRVRSTCSTAASACAGLQQQALLRIGARDVRRRLPDSRTRAAGRSGNTSSRVRRAA